MTTVLLGLADQNLVADLTAIIDELEDVTVRAVARNTVEVQDLVRRLEPDVVFVHDELGPEPSLQLIRDLSARRPGTAIVQISATRTSNSVIRALEAGARGVVAYPFAFEDVSSRLQTALEWAGQMQQLLLEGTAANAGQRGRVVAVVGAKGGVGATTVAVHLAQDHITRTPDIKVCLVDVDVEKGDVSAVLDVRQSVSIADVAKVSEDLSVHSVNDALIQHETGIHLLLAPIDVREAEAVTPEALRAVIEVLRREFPLVIIDGGGHVSPAQAAVIEIADEVVVVTTADTLAMRGMRKRILAWEALGVRDEATLKVLVNKVDKTSIFPASAVAKLTTAHVLPTTIPLSQRVLEAAVNARTPQAVTEVAWWRLMLNLRQELGIAAAPAVAAAPVAAKSRSKRGKKVETAGAESGAIAIETAGIIPLALLTAVMCWHIAVIGLSFIWGGHATSIAAREYAITSDTTVARNAAQRAIPDAFGRHLTVSNPSGDRISVTVDIPLSFADSIGFPDTFTTTRDVVREP